MAQNPEVKPPSDEKVAEGVRDQVSEVTLVANLTNSFFNSLDEYRTMYEREVAKSSKEVAIFHSKPANAEFRRGLFMAEDGTIWKKYDIYSLDDKTWLKVTRKSDEPYAPFKETRQFDDGKLILEGGKIRGVERPDGTKLIFVKHSDVMRADEDWCWEINERYYLRNNVTLRHSERLLQIAQKDLKLVEILLSKRSEIEEWMKRYANGQGALREEVSFVHHDLKKLIGEFAPEFSNEKTGIEAYGHVAVTLTSLLDHMACGHGVRAYLY